MTSSQFRLWSGRNVAKLLAKFGPAHLTLIEDSVQESFLRALKSWPIHGQPTNPEAWLHKVAKNLVLDELKRPLEFTTDETLDFQATEETILDDELALIALCSSPSLSPEVQLTLTLKEVFGLSTLEIAKALRQTPEAVQQRIVRAKKTLAQLDPKQHNPNPHLVLKVAYLVFNEGYLATTGSDLSRPDLCLDAIRLVQRLLQAHNLPSAHALLALMLFHSSRLPARIGPDGDLRLLKDQDRSLWDQSMIALGFKHLALSAEGEKMTPYHAEAAIASVHATATEYDQTDWPLLLQYYDDLARLSPSPIVLLNRAVVLAEIHGPEAGLTQLQAIEDSKSLSNHYLLPATKGDFLLRLGNPQKSLSEFLTALNLTQNDAEKRFLQLKIEEVKQKTPPIIN